MNQYETIVVGNPVRRAWNELNAYDVRMLIDEISSLQKEEQLKDVYLSNEEILQLLGKIKGIIVCSGVLPAFEDFYYDLVMRENIEIKFYAWKFSFRQF